jgi:hypothetical protein
MLARYEMARLANRIGIKRGHFLTRDKGELAYKLLQDELLNTPEGVPLILEFPPAQLVDSSFADESAVRLGEEIIKGKYGNRCLILEGLTLDSITNFEAVISLRGIKLPLLIIEISGDCGVIGKLEDNLRETLKFVLEKGALTASDLVSQLGLAVNTASTRLKRLHDLHLVRREYQISDRGLQYIYQCWGGGENATSKPK